MTKRRRQAIPSAADMPALRDSLADASHRLADWLDSDT